jgi:hypothetical protein
MIELSRANIHQELKDKKVEKPEAGEGIINY